MSFFSWNYLDIWILYLLFLLICDTYILKMYTKNPNSINELEKQYEKTTINKIKFHIIMQKMWWKIG